ncbi:hypothetical protein Rhe02_27310 [Rhizocola hellebori]|uniref:AB hydrolase-1 domain-containing protein n=1 Tax=Rhizocola hellebori TaxID=1392758 RepID=A0A8J3Q670_9ACTN|nr:alpha/beta fold hydrolase [Rhizocola hellebori]GIH04664.1 hypothetical protein Rhe02_27310 [Rhizocola hellebori]
MRALCLTLAATIALTACSSKTPAAPPALKPGGSACEGLVQPGGKQVRFGENDGLAGVVIGDGKAAVVLAHQAPGSLCEWLPYARSLAERGYRALAFDFNGAGSSSFTGHLGDQDVADAVTYLRGQGVTQVFLMGASRGGTAVVTAGARIAPPVDGVISLSAPAAFAGMNAREAAPALAVPVLYICAEFDTSFVDAAKELYDLSKGSKDRRLKITYGSQHGVAMLMPGVDNEPGLEITGFLKTYAKG